VDDPLGLAGGARGVEDEELVLGVHLLGRPVEAAVGVARLAHEAVPPVVAPLLDLGERRVALRPGAALHHHHVLDARALGERLVGVALERDHLAAAVRPVGGDEHPALRVVDAVAQRLGREAAEDHRVDGADARAGEHRHHRLGDHRQVDGDPVPLLHAEAVEDEGELVDLAVEVPVGEGALVAGLALEDERRLVAARAVHVAVEAVDARVERAVGEPPRVRRRPVEGAGERARPLELARQARPERLGVARRLVVDRGVAGDGLRPERLGRREGAGLGEEGFEVGHGGREDGGSGRRRGRARRRADRNARTRT
jgi:hypothetical protein